jgi:hypothetical protein
VQPISFKRHRFPADAIRYAVWLYFRFTLSIRDVEELLAERGIDVRRGPPESLGAIASVWQSPHHSASRSRSAHAIVREAGRARAVPPCWSVSGSPSLVSGEQSGEQEWAGRLST